MLGDWPNLDSHFGTKKGLSDCQQITLILRNRNCLIAKNCCLTPLFLTDKIKMDRIPTKIKWKIVSLLHCISVIKTCMISHQIFYFLLFLLAFTSADIIFHKFLELHSTSDKKIFVTNFPFLTDSLKPPPLPHQASLPQFVRGFQPPSFFMEPTPWTSLPPFSNLCFPSPYFCSTPS